MEWNGMFFFFGTTPFWSLHFHFHFHFRCQCKSSSTRQQSIQQRFVGGLAPFTHTVEGKKHKECMTRALSIFPSRNIAWWHIPSPVSTNWIHHHHHYLHHRPSISHRGLVLMGSNGTTIMFSDGDIVLWVSSSIPLNQEEGRSKKEHIISHHITAQSCYQYGSSTLLRSSYPPIFQPQSVLSCDSLAHLTIGSSIPQDTGHAMHDWIIY